MPHEQPWLDYEVRKQAQINREAEKAMKVIRVQNKAMVLMQTCPELLRTPETCRACKEPMKKECLKIWKEQNELWGKDETPVLAVNTVNTASNMEASRQNAKFQKSQESKRYQHHTQDANGISKKSRSLFDLEAA